MEYKLSLFDTPLVHQFSRISAKKNGDLRKVFNRTLVKHEPVNAVVRLHFHPGIPFFPSSIHLDLLANRSKDTRNVGLLPSPLPPNSILSLRDSVL